MVLFQHLQRVNENIRRVGHNLTEKPLASIARVYNNKLIAGITAVLLVAAALMFFVRPEFGGLPEIGLARKGYESTDRTEREENDSPLFTLPEWLLPAQTDRPQEEMAYRPPPPRRRYEQYLGVLAGIVTIIIIVIMMRSVINRKKKDKPGDPYDIISLTTPDTEKKQPPAARPGLFLTPNQRVRRMFYKEVDGRRRSGLSLTPASTSVTIANDIGDDISRLEGYYRIARYSGRELTKEDVAEIKRKS
jgi:hypothetical protein